MSRVRVGVRQKNVESANVLKLSDLNGGADETRTRDLRRDRPAF